MNKYINALVHPKTIVQKIIGRIRGNSVNNMDVLPQGYSYSCRGISDNSLMFLGNVTQSDRGIGLCCGPTPPKDRPQTALYKIGEETIRAFLNMREQIIKDSSTPPTHTQRARVCY